MVVKKIIILCLFFINTLFAQVVWEPVSSHQIYNFLDELSADQIIEINSVIKPYSRQYIAEKLQEANEKISVLNNRQKSELQNFITEYAIETNSQLPTKWDIFKKKSDLNFSIDPIGLYYRDSLFKFSFTPIYGRIYYIKQNDNAYHNRGGGKINAYIGKNVGIYANVQDNYIKNYVFGKKNYLTQYEGGNYKFNVGGREGGDYSEMRGGITLNWDWGSIGLIKDNNEWGDNYNGANIFSSRSPSFAQIKLQMSPTKWFDFNYFHGWLVSMVVDSSRSYITSNGDFRAIYRNKYIAANMFTIRPFKNLNISAGNSIVYSDINIQPAYLIPFMFYKSIDHTINSEIDNQNSQMFLNISSKNIKHLHLYGSLFVDEWSFSRLSEPNRRNFTSIKAGLSISNLLIKNYSFIAEYTQTNPLTYKHRVSSITYATNNFNLGHYMIDNARDIFLAIRVTPVNKLKVELYGNIAQKGNDNQYVLIPGQRLDEFPLLKDIIWEKNELGLNIDFCPLQKLVFNFGYCWSNVFAKEADGKTAQYYLNKFGSPFYHGNNHIFQCGMNIGL